MSPSPSVAGNEMLNSVQELYVAFGRKDIAAVMSALADDVIWAEPPNPYNPAGGTHRGHSGFLEWARIGNEAEEILALEARQFLVGENTIAAVGFTKCRARATGRVYETDFVHLVTFRSGKIARFQEFFDTFAAAEAFRT